MEGTILIVDGNPRTQRDFASASEAELVVCERAQAGLNACCAIEPVCVVLGSKLEDFSAAWVARSIRSQPTLASSCLIVALLDEDDEPTHLALLRGGVDVCLRRPRRAEVLVASVLAVISASTRGAPQVAGSPTTRRPSSARPRTMAPLAGEVDDAAAMIAIRQIESDRRTGDLVFTSVGGRKLVLEFASGVLVGGRLDSAAIETRDAIREALHWTDGAFTFAKRAQRPAPPGSPGLSHLLTSMDVSKKKRSVGRSSTIPPASTASPRTRPPAARTKSAPPPRAKTLASGLSMPDRPERRSSSRIRTAIRVESAPPSRRGPSQRLDPRVDLEDDVIEAENVASSGRHKD